MDGITLGLLRPEGPADAQNEARWHSARAITPEVMHADLRIYGAYDLCPRLSQVTLPVLHLRSQYDATVNDDNAREIREGIPNVTVRVLSGVGHIPMLEGPAIFKKAVGSFLLDGVPPR